MCDECAETPWTECYLTAPRPGELSRFGCLGIFALWVVAWLAILWGLTALLG